MVNKHGGSTPEFPLLQSELIPASYRRRSGTAALASSTLTQQLRKICIGLHICAIHL
jgi:hypothetical protein